MKDDKVMLTVTMNQLDSPKGESELLNLRIIASKKAFSVESIVESVTTLLKGNWECLYESDDFLDNADFNEGGFCK